jgi:SAM-dependent methyltransferase
MKPPLRPNAEVAAALGDCIAGRADSVLLLGVTPELAALSPNLTAVDRNQNMIDHIWPGNSPERRAILGEWLELTFPCGAFSAVIGDGSLNNVRYPDGHRRFYEQLARVLSAGGRFASRVFATPDPAASIKQVCDDALRGRAGSFHAFKWRLAMSIAAESGDANVPVANILATFNARVPDRGKLLVATGWSSEDFSTIDLYAGSAQFNCFPTRRQLLDVIPPEFTEIHWRETGGYDLADCCPLLVMDRRS